MIKHALIGLCVLGWAGACHAQKLTSFYDYALIETETGATVSVEQAGRALGAFDVVFLGETHEHPANHKAQFDLFLEMAAQGRALTLSLEQFERDTQGLMDQYLAGTIGEDTLLREGRAWDNYTTSYRPLVEFAKERNWPVLAANAPNDLVRCMGQKGPNFLNDLAPEIGALVASDLDLSDGAYKTKFYGFAHGAAGHGEGSDMAAAIARSYAAQVLRDETMAESIARHLERSPERIVVHLNGSFHSAGFLGTAERVIARYPEAKIAVVHPVHVEEIGDITENQREEGTFLLAIKPAPPMHVSAEERERAASAIMAFRAENPCIY